MGEAAGVYGCVVSEDVSGELTATASYFTFGDGKVVFVSDHCQAEEMSQYRNAVPILDGSVLLFDIYEQEIRKRHYPQANTLTREKNDFIHINEVSFPCDERFLLYCLVLPRGYYPTSYFSGKPHFAGPRGERIAITWWFKERTTIKVGFKRDAEKAIAYTYLDKPTFPEKHPLLKRAFEHAEAFAAKVLSNKIPDGGL